MKHLFTLFVISFIFSSQFTNGQITVYSGTTIINSLSFCSSPKESLSIYIEESKTGPNWNYYFPNATGNTITLNLNNGFTFGNNSVNAENEVKYTPTNDITNVSVSYTSTQVITITFDHSGTNIDNLYLENIILVTPVDYNVNSANFTVNSCLYNASNVAPLARTSSSVMFSSLTKLNTPHY